MERPFFSRISWGRVAAGALVALLAALTAGGAVVASLAAVALGGFLAARLAAQAGLLQGSAVAALFILAATLLGLPGVPSETTALVAFDLAHLVAGAAGGWLATRS